MHCLNYLSFCCREDFKRIAEETTLLMVQTLIEHRLEARPDVPAHYRRVVEDMIRAALPPPPPRHHQYQQHQHQHQPAPPPNRGGGSRGRP